jgi:hypothetical protein
MPAVIVAIEQRFPKDQRIIADDLAYAMLPSGMKAFVWLMRPAFARDWMVRATEKSAPGLWALMACRKRYIDEKLIEAVDEIDAVVNLGAGFDTAYTACRLSLTCRRGRSISRKTSRPSGCGWASYSERSPLTSTSCRSISTGRTWVLR